MWLKIRTYLSTRFQNTHKYKGKQAYQLFSQSSHTLSLVEVDVHFHK